MLSQLAEVEVEKLKHLANHGRKIVLKAVHHAGAGHMGGPLSMMEIVTTLLFSQMNVNPDEPAWPERDRLVLSKGHSAVGLYAMMALRGFMSETEVVETFDTAGTRLQGHPDMTRLPGLDMSTGSLGQGLSAGVGMALAAKHLNRLYRTYVIIGDGETQEGQIWEAADVAAKYSLDNLTAILDHNNLQQFGWLDDGSRRAPIRNPSERFRAFGWNVLECNGHDFSSLHHAFSNAKAHRGAPSVIIAETVKGKGVSFMERQFDWHSKIPTDHELQAALAELEEAVKGGVEV